MRYVKLSVKELRKRRSDNDSAVYVQTFAVQVDGGPLKLELFDGSVHTLVPGESLEISTDAFMRNV